MPKCVKIGQTVADIAVFMIFKMAAALVLDFLKFEILTSVPAEGQYASLCQISSKSAERLRIYDNLTVFQNGGRPPSWNCCVCI